MTCKTILIPFCGGGAVVRADKVTCAWIDYVDTCYERLNVKMEDNELSGKLTKSARAVLLEIQTAMVSGGDQTK